MSGTKMLAGLTVAAGLFFCGSIAFAKPAKVTICHKFGAPAEITMEVPPTAVPGHLGHGDVLGACPPLIAAGLDTFPSGGSITVNFGPVPQIVTLSSPAGSNAIIQRAEQVRGTIETEMLSLELVGTIGGGVPISVRVGSFFDLPPSTGKIINITRDANGDFVSGDSFFDVFFEIEIGEGAGSTVVRNEEAVHLEARNRETKEPAPITSLPPNDDPNDECIEYAENVLEQTGGLITDPIHIPFANDPEKACARIPATFR